MARSPPYPPATRKGAADAHVSERTLALEAMIGGSMDALQRTAQAPTPGEALVFVGNWNDALPRLLIHDQVLEPVDKIVWAVIRTQADPQRGTAFPSYATIGRLANVGSDATVSRAIAILRLSRWLTLCARARDGWGRFRGSVYALHDEPLPLADTLHLDRGYMEFAYQATGHHHARVARVAASVVRSLELDLADGTDPSDGTDLLADRLAAQQAIAEAAPENVDAAGTTRPVSVYGVRSTLRLQLRQQLAAGEEGDRLQNLKAADANPLPQILKPADQLQNLKTVPPQNLKPQISRAAVVVVSNNNTTTATAPDIPPQGTPASATDSPLASLGVLCWPEQLSANHRHLAAIQLRAVPQDLRQAVLDVLDRRLQLAERGGERLHYGPLAYLKTLCAKAAAGQLVLPQADPPATPPPDSAAVELARLQARLRVARADHAHWQRIATLQQDPERQAPILALVAQTAEQVAQLEAELAALPRDAARRQG